MVSPYQPDFHGGIQKEADTLESAIKHEASSKSKISDDQYKNIKGREFSVICTLNSKSYRIEVKFAQDISSITKNKLESALNTQIAKTLAVAAHFQLAQNNRIVLSGQDEITHFVGKNQGNTQANFKQHIFKELTQLVKTPLETIKDNPKYSAMLKTSFVAYKIFDNYQGKLEDFFDKQPLAPSTHQAEAIKASSEIKNALSFRDFIDNPDRELQEGEAAYLSANFDELLKPLNNEDKLKVIDLASRFHETIKEDRNHPKDLDARKELIFKITSFAIEIPDLEPFEKGRQFYFLGNHYEEGFGCHQDKKRAENYYDKAAKNGFPIQAYFRLIDGENLKENANKIIESLKAINPMNENQWEWFDKAETVLKEVESEKNKEKQ